MARDNNKTQVVGHSPRKVDGVGLVTGTAQYVDDIKIQGMLYAGILTSPHAHARIKEIDISAAEKLPGVIMILTYQNTPRVPHTTAGQGFPEPSPYDSYMFDSKVRYVGDRVACVAAESETACRHALKKIKVEYELLPAILDPRKSIEENAPVIHDEKESSGIHDASRNIAAHYEVELGAVDKALSKSDIKVEGEFRVQYAQHCPIEPHVTISYLDDRNRIVIRTSTQVPFHCRRIVAQCLQIPEQEIRVIKPRIGGAFGAKQEILLEDLCAYITLKTRRPVRIKYSRKEEFISSRTRHPMIVKMKIGANKDGSLQAMDQDVLSNTGAYGSHSLTVLTNVGSKTLPLYWCDNIRFRGSAVYTNMPVAGAYRGYGGTQGSYALQVLMDELAEKLKIDVLDLQRKWHIRLGQTHPMSAALGEGKEGHENPIHSCGLDACMDLGAEAIGWKEKRNQAKKGRFRRGVGMAALMQGSGIPNIDMGAARIKMNEDGSFHLFMGATDLGTGSDTILAQIAAETLGVPVEKILVYSSDTDMTPFDVGAYASSTTYISGGAVHKAALDCRTKILQVAGEILGGDPASLKVDNGVVTAANGKKTSYDKICQRALYSRNQFQIEGIGSHTSPVSPPPFAAHFAEVEVDMETGKLRVLDYVAACDCGVAIHPKMAEGQVEGSVANGIGYALSESLYFDEHGRCLNPSFFDYKILTSLETGCIRAILVPTYEPNGPYGAKSVAEININGPIPAIANAVYNACGIRLYQTPFTPESVWRSLKEAGKI